MAHNFTQQEVLNEINSKTIEYDLDYLRFPFGFNRVDGKAFLMKRLLSPSITEEQMSYATPLQLHLNIENWCRENNIKYAYNISTNRYHFAVYEPNGD